MEELTDEAEDTTPRQANSGQAEPPSDSPGVRPAVELTRLLAAVGCESDRRQGDVLKRVMTSTVTRCVRILHGFVRDLPDDSEYAFSPGECYFVRITASYSFYAHRLRRKVEVHDIEVVAKLTMSHEHPPAGFRVRGVWTGAFEFVTEDDDGGGIPLP